MHRLARRDGVHARRQPLQHVEQLLRIFHHAGKVRRQVDKLASPAILFGAGLVLRADQRPSDLRCSRRQLRILVHAAARQLADAQPRPQRLFEADLYLVVVEHALLALEAQRVKHLCHRLARFSGIIPTASPGV